MVYASEVPSNRPCWSTCWNYDVGTILGYSFWIWPLDVTLVSAYGPPIVSDHSISIQAMSYFRWQVCDPHTYVSSKYLNMHEPAAHSVPSEVIHTESIPMKYSQNKDMNNSMKVCYHLLYVYIPCSTSSEVTRWIKSNISNILLPEVLWLCNNGE